MSFDRGTPLGPYEILEPIASAGGERYKASDTRSDRLVSITVLPPALAGRPEIRERLERDAQAISALSRSGISGPIEIGHQAPSTDFVVAEYLDGETLAARLARGRLPLDEALGIAIAIAESLDQAHRQGIVHGGLSPSAVLLTDDGPKLLDFGVAGLLQSAPKLLPDSGRSASEAERSATPHASPSMATTRTCASPGETLPVNAAYMAPELLAGGAPDARSDIFSFGTLLYEMASGQPAFSEKTPALLVAAVQSVDPEPVSTLEPMAPSALDHIVARCLAKDPAQRMQTSWDLARQLQWVSEGGSQVGVPAPVAARRRKQDRIVWAALAAGLILAAVLAPAVWTSFRSRPDPEPVRFTLAEVPSVSGVPISISPDGRWIAGSPGGGVGVAGVLLDSVTPQQLAPDNTVTQPFWSPDSRSIAFFEGGLLKRLEVAGGPAQTIAEAPPPIANGAWNADGVILFSSGGVIHRVLAAGGEPTPVTALDPALGETTHLAPSFLPDGRHFLYVAISGDSAIYVADLESGERTRLFAADSRPMYAEPGYILFNRAGTVFAQPFDPDARAVTGEPLRITDGVALFLGNPGLTDPALNRSANFAVSQTGVLVFKFVVGSGPDAPAAADVPQFALEWRDRSGVAEAVGSQAAYAGIDLAPGGNQFAAHLHESDGGDSWTFNLGQGRFQQLTFNAGQHNTSPVWSPDGERIAFGSQRNGQWGLYMKRADGTGAESLVFESSTAKMPMSWSPDGNLLVYSEGTDVWAVPVDGAGEPFPILNSPANELFPSVSPDGAWILYQSDETGRTEIYVQQFPEGPTKRRVSTEGGIFPRWRSGDGGEIYYGWNAGMHAVEIDFASGAPQPGIPRLLFPLPNPTLGGGGTGPLGGINAHPLYHRFAVSADGERFLLPRPGNNAVGGGFDDGLRDLADGGGGGGGINAVTTVILNWPGMLEER